MLVRFVVSNFLSLKEEVEFNMLTGSFGTHPHHVYQAGNVEVLKAAAIYGANGAGKSNLVKAISYLQGLVKEGAITTSVNSKKFKLDPACLEKPIRFEIEFFTYGKLYSYGIVIDSTDVVEEWLYELGVTEKDRLVFERKVDKSGKPVLNFAKEYQKTQKQKLLIELLQENLLKEHQLLLAKNEELQIEEINKIKKWIEQRVLIIYPETKYGGLVQDIIESKDSKSFINETLATLNTGIESIDIKEEKLEDFSQISNEKKEEIIRILDEDSGRYAALPTKEGPILVSYEYGSYSVKRLVLNHKGLVNFSVPFELSEESDGTRRLLDYIPAILMINVLPVTFIIDEVDQSIHPSLLKALLQKVMENENTQGQLIFTTHESNLLDLDIFRQDEIWFAEKERETGATQFYSLSEFKPRYDSDIEKGYLNGRFGAIPFLADLENLNWHRHAEAE